tara:strand:+ start:385 stop:654 length:270 start_codon:yes stop_codon:yes gene_type:complete
MTNQAEENIYINIHRNLIINKHIEEQVEIMEKFFEDCPHKNDVNDLINQILDKYMDYHSIFEGQEDKLKLFTWDSVRKHFNSKSVRHIN